MQRNIFTRLIYTLLFLPLLAACTSDEASDGTEEGQPIEIGLRLAIDDGEGDVSSSSRLSRATNWSYGSDTDYAEGEGLYSWFVVMLDADNKVEYVFTSDKGYAEQTAAGSLSNLKEDLVNYDNITADTGTPLYVHTTTGNKTFYSFANISQANVIAAAGLSTTSDKVFTQGEIIDPAALDAATYALSGNGYDPLKRTDRLKGIPMSGKQTVTLTYAEHYNQTLTLWVVRMLAKMTFRVTNLTSSDLTLTGITLSPLTQNPTGSEDNIYLLPNVTTPEATTTQMPHLATTATTGSYSYTVGDVMTIPASSAETKEISFYVNESLIADTDTYQEFMLTLSLTCSDGTTTEQRYALITNDDNAWSYIARNDRRVIPISLQEYKLTITPYDYPPIAVLPSSAYEKNGTFVATFHAEGDFHLVPSVTAYDGTTLTGATLSNVSIENLSIPDGMYAAATTRDDVGGSETANDGEAESGLPVWYATGGYIHGTLADDISTNENTKNGCISRHRLTLSIASDGIAQRTLVYPIIIQYEP